MNNTYKRLLDLVVEGKWGTKDKSGVRKPKPKSKPISKGEKEFHQDQAIERDYLRPSIMP